MLEAFGLGFRRGARWLWRDLSLRTQAGEVLGILGLNGAGKSTLIRCLAGIWSPTEGHIVRPPRWGYVPQKAEMAFDFSAREVVSGGLAGRKQLFARLTSQDHAMIAASFNTLGIEDKMDTPFVHLSGGEQQLVLIARALAAGSTHLLLDEPLASLDLARQAQVLCLLRRLADDRGMSIVFSTHAPNHLLAVAERTLIIGLEGRPEAMVTHEAVSASRMSQLYGLAVGISDSAYGTHVLADLGTLPITKAQVGSSRGDLDGGVGDPDG